MSEIIKNKVIIITGQKGEGKTTKLLRVIEVLKGCKIVIKGFSANGEWINGERSSFVLKDINSDKALLLCSNKNKLGFEQHGRFFFNPKAINYGQKLLGTKSNSKELIVIDEVGPFEIKNKIWHDSIVFQLNETNNVLLIVIRKTLVDDIVKKYGISNVTIHDIETQDERIIEEISEEFLMEDTIK